MPELELIDLRACIESLACEGGEFYLVCGRSGARPVPAIGLRFDSRNAARAAARVTEQYREVLRRYDPELPRYHVVVCQEPEAPGNSARVVSSRRYTNGRTERTTTPLAASEPEENNDV